MRNLSWLMAAIMVPGLGACTNSAPKASETPAAANHQLPTQSKPAPDSESSLPLKEFMGHVMERNAEQIWAWSAIEIDRQGQHSGKPASEQEWENAESDALTLQQLTYVLQHSSARIDDPRWAERIGAVRAAAAASAKAAEDKNFPALVKAGNQINAGCVSCHWTFAQQLEKTPPDVPLPRR